jgi:hypothetical protein
MCSELVSNFTIGESTPDCQPNGVWDIQVTPHVFNFSNSGPVTGVRPPTQQTPFCFFEIGGGSEFTDGPS